MTLLLGGFPVLGLRIVQSPHAYKIVVSDERLFPASRHRSRRIHKKLVKRYGGEYRIKHEPVAYVLDGHTLVCHPSIYEELKRRDRKGP